MPRPAGTVRVLTSREPEPQFPLLFAHDPHAVRAAGAEILRVRAADDAAIRESPANSASRGPSGLGERSLMPGGALREDPPAAGGIRSIAILPPPSAAGRVNAQASE